MSTKEECVDLNKAVMLIQLFLLQQNLPESLDALQAETRTKLSSLPQYTLDSVCENVKLGNWELCLPVLSKLELSSAVSTNMYFCFLVDLLADGQVAFATRLAAEKSASSIEPFLSLSNSQLPIGKRFASHLETARLFHMQRSISRAQYLTLFDPHILSKRREECSLQIKDSVAIEKNDLLYLIAHSLGSTPFPLVLSSPTSTAANATSAATIAAADGRGASRISRRPKLANTIRLDDVKIKSASFSSTLPIFAVCGADGVCEMYSTANLALDTAICKFQEEDRFLSHKHAIVQSAFSPDSAFCSVDSAGTVKVWDLSGLASCVWTFNALESGTVVNRFPDSVTFVRLLHEHLVVGKFSGFVEVYEMQNPVLLARVRLDSRAVDAAVITQENGQCLLLLCSASQLYKMDLPKGAGSASAESLASIHTFDVREVLGMAVGSQSAPRDQMVVVCGYGLYVFSTASWKPLQVRKLSILNYGASENANLMWIVPAEHRDTLCALLLNDLSSPEHLQSIALPSVSARAVVQFIGTSPDGSSLIVCTDDQRVHLYQ
eukprot:ANDGO_05880.mRNA.1 hypothetical protein